MFPVVSWELGHGRLVFKLVRRRLRKTIFAPRVAAVIALTAISVLGQQKPVPPTPAAGIEFPVHMQQKVSAGKTPVGSKIRARLVIATLVKGTVIPEGAILSGQVTESLAKSVTLPSRLGVRMDSAQWKNGSFSIRVYLTAWYYPVATPNQGQPSDLSDGSSPVGSVFPRSTRNHHATTPPGSDADAPSLPAPNIPQHRVLMKNVESMRNSDGTVTLTSNHSNLKLDKGTTYVLAADGLMPAK